MQKYLLRRKGKVYSINEDLLTVMTAQEKTRQKKRKEKWQKQINKRKELSFSKVYYVLLKTINLEKVVGSLKTSISPETRRSV